MKTVKLNYDLCNAIFDIAVAECGAAEEDRAAYNRYACADDVSATEFRFQGDLGYGGKIYNDGGRVYISCYPEDMTSNRQKAKASRRFWSALRSVSSGNLKLENDPFVKRYSVSRWGIYASHINPTWAGEVRKRLIDKMAEQGWVSHDSDYGSITLTHPDIPARAIVGKLSPNGQAQQFGITFV